MCMAQRMRISFTLAWTPRLCSTCTNTFSWADTHKPEIGTRSCQNCGSCGSTCTSVKSRTTPVALSMYSSEKSRYWCAHCAVSLSYYPFPLQNIQDNHEVVGMHNWINIYFQEKKGIFMLYWPLHFLCITCSITRTGTVQVPLTTRATYFPVGAVITMSHTRLSIWWAFS